MPRLWKISVALKPSAISCCHQNTAHAQAQRAWTHCQKQALHYKRRLPLGLLMPKPHKATQYCQLIGLEAPLKQMRQKAIRWSKPIVVQVRKHTAFGSASNLLVAEQGISHFRSLDPLDCWVLLPTTDLSTTECGLCCCIVSAHGVQPIHQTST